MKTRLLTTLAALLLALTSWANGTEIDGIYYELNNSTNKASVTFTGVYGSYNPSSTAYTGSITIPASVTYDGTVYSVTTIGYGAFIRCTGLTSISIPASVTTIGDWAFSDCTGLTSLTIPASVTTIGVGAFQDCKGLTSITIPSSVTTIGDQAFLGCTGLKSISIPASVTSIGRFAFDGCTGLTSIKVEEGNTAYDSRENCNAIIETASNTLVAGCMNTTIPNSVTTIGVGALEGCTGLTSISIPASVTTIGDWAFYGCKGLTSISIPSSVTSIGDGAFSYCTGLTSINIPNSVTNIGNGAFCGCNGLTCIKVEEGNTAYDSRENCNAIIETASNTLVAGCMNTTIPNSVTAIGDGAFEGCTGLTSIDIPSSVTSIGGTAFYGCTGLTSISIPNSVTTIGEGAFYRCTGLTSISIPASVTSIGRSAFSYCSGLTDIYALRTDPAAYNCSAYAFYEVSATLPTLHVPIGSKEAYAATAPWSNFKNIVEYDASGIEPIGLTPTEADAASYYNLQGQRIARPQRGQIVIQRNADGTGRKVLVK